MTAPEFTPLSPSSKGPRWIKTHLTLDDLKKKRIFAQFTTRSGNSYEGVGDVRAVRNSVGRLAIDLVFTRVDSAYQHTDILFFLSSSQAERIHQAPEGANYDLIYEGHLAPDERADAPPGA